MIYARFVKKISFANVLYVYYHGLVFCLGRNLSIFFLLITITIVVKSHVVIVLRGNTNFFPDDVGKCCCICSVQSCKACDT